MKQKIIYLFILALSIPAALSSQVNWISTNGPEGGSFFSVFSNKNYAFCEDGKYLYRTNNAQTWEKLPINDYYPMNFTTEILVGIKSKLFPSIFVQTHLCVSLDNGETWEEYQLPTQSGDNYIQSIGVATHGIYLLSDYRLNKIYRTKDLGITWDTIITPSMYPDNLQVFDDKVFIDTHDGIFEYDDKNDLFKLIIKKDSFAYYYNYFVSDSIIFLNANNNNILESKDYGNSWTSTKVGSNNTNNNFVKHGNSYFLSIGQTWFKENINSNWKKYEESEEYFRTYLTSFKGSLLASTYERGIQKLDTLNHQWILVNEGITAGFVHGLEYCNDTLWASTATGVSKYNVGSNDWSKVNYFKVSKEYNYDIIKSNKTGKIVVTEAYTNNIYISKDYGKSWTELGTNNFDDPFSCFIFDPKFIFWAGERLFVGDDFCAKYSDDYGITWVTSEYGLDKIVEFKGKLYGLVHGKLEVSVDNGTTWQDGQCKVKNISSLVSTMDKLFILSGFWQPFNSTESTLYYSNDGLEWYFGNDGLPNFEVDRYQINIWEIGKKYFLNHSYGGTFQSVDSCATWLPVFKENLDLFIHDSTMYSKMGGIYKSKIPDYFGEIGSGQVYFDENQNGIKDANEVNMSAIKLEILNQDESFDQIAYTNSVGKYNFIFTQGDSKSIKPAIDLPYLEGVNPNSISIVTMTENLDFGVKLKPSVIDLSANGQINGRPRPGFGLNIHVKVQNLGTLQSKGTLGIKLDKNFIYNNAVPAPSALIGKDSLIWEVGEMALFTNKDFIIEGHLDSAALLTTAFKTKGHISTSTVDQNDVNNNFEIIDTIVGSYDPNEKRVSPAIGLTKQEIEKGAELYYTILFQNTGTYEAEKVRITDKLDTALNIRTFRIVNASHRITNTEIKAGGLLEFEFNGIALPDSNSNEAASHGFVTFAIQRNKGYNPNYTIHNKAAIYFDYNQPIITNTTSTTLYDPSITSTHDLISPSPRKLKLKITPNPTSSEFSLKVNKNLTGKGQLLVYNIYGNIVLNLNINDITTINNVNVVNLIAGIYIVELITEDEKSRGTLVVTH